MNHLFERIRLQAQFKRLYDNYRPDQADQLIREAWSREQNNALTQPERPGAIRKNIAA
jgi:hypothetical protein